MKKISILIITILFYSNPGISQNKGTVDLWWESTDFDFFYYAGGSKEDPGTSLKEVSAVSQDIAWATFADWQVANAPTLPRVTYTTDCGQSWTTVDGPGAKNSQYSNICAVSDKNAWVSVHTAEPGLYFTEDAGKTWTKVLGIFEDTTTICNFVYFWDKNTGFAQGDVKNGVFTLYSTSDGGKTWNRNISIPAKENELGGVQGFFDVAQDGTLYWQSDQGRVFKTTDKGQSFTVSETGLTDTYNRQGLKVLDENTVIFPAFNSVDKTYKYKITQDGGTTWNDWKPIGENETFGTFSFCAIPGTNQLVSISSVGSITEEEKNFISYCMNGRTGEEWTIFEQFTYAEQRSTQLAYVKFFNFDGYIKGYAASFNYGPTYKGIDGILVWDTPMWEYISVNQKHSEQLEIRYDDKSGIIYASNIEKISKISLINTIGQTVKTANNSTKISTSEIKKGFYIIQVETEKGNVITDKILVY